MTIRTFIFCDRCNAEGVRIPDRRHVTDRDITEDGRRKSDGRAWIEVKKVEEAEGWASYGTGKHTCPRCFSVLD